MTILKKRIGIIGNPNSGKTTLFNALTGSHQHVGNWPGVTVERKLGSLVIDPYYLTVYDLPGIYSLSASTLDEKVARDFVHHDKPDLIINIVDASNLERNLYLTTQLIEMRAPMIVVLNMMDVAKSKKIKIDVEELERLLGCSVVTISASRRQGLDDLKHKIVQFLDAPKNTMSQVYYAREVEQAIKEVQEELRTQNIEHVSADRWNAVKLLEEDVDDGQVDAFHQLHSLITRHKKQIETILGEDVDIVIADSRYGFVHSVCRKVVDRSDIVRRGMTDAIDRVVLNQFLGLPIFLFAMYFMFWVTINFGGCFIDFFDGVTGAIFVDGFAALLNYWHLPSFLVLFLAQGLGGGIQTVSTFIPPIFFIFLCLSFLEDSGYMARAAFVMDRLMRFIGLPGKAFVPLLIGFGCTVPAIMASRTLDNERDRILSILMNPLMSCGARMPVYAVFAAAFFPQIGGIIVFSLYLIGILLAILTAYIFKNTILKGEASMFVMELPPYHIPTLQGMVIHTWSRLKSFIFKAGQAILLVVFLLNILTAVSIDGKINQNDPQRSVLSKVAQVAQPVFQPMGINKENWPAVVGIVTGIFAKEAVIGSLETIYTQMDQNEKPLIGKEPSFNFWGEIKNSFQTIPDNLSRLTLPFSLSGLLGTDIDAALESVGVKDNTYYSLTKRFDGKAGAFAYLLLILIYMPCVAAIAAVYRELNLKWMLFEAIYLSALAWIVATVFYQIFRFDQHPVSSSGWIIFCACLFMGFIFWLRRQSSWLKN